MAMGKESWKEVRSTLTNLLSKDTATLRDNAELKSKALVKQSDA
jgi:fumarylacetoacetase